MLFQVPVLAQRLAARSITTWHGCFAASAGEVCDGLWRVGAIAYVGDPEVYALGGTITAMSPQIAGGLGSYLLLGATADMAFHGVRASKSVCPEALATTLVHSNFDGSKVCHFQVSARRKRAVDPVPSHGDGPP